MTATSEDHRQPNEEELSSPQRSSGLISTGIKLALAAGFLLSALATLRENSTANATSQTVDLEDDTTPRRRLQGVNGVPSYMNDLMKDLKARKKLFDDTPPEEIKYWFEYTGPLQVGAIALCHVRYSS